MSLFLITFILIYSSLHLYVFLKVKAAYAIGAYSVAALVVFMALMVFSPLSVYRLERYGLESPARLAAYVGYTWMGLLSSMSRPQFS